jgi:hypothetical protein
VTIVLGKGAGFDDRDAAGCRVLNSSVAGKPSRLRDRGGQAQITAVLVFAAEANGPLLQTTVFP